MKSELRFVAIALSALASAVGVLTATGSAQAQLPHNFRHILPFSRPRSVPQVQRPGVMFAPMVSAAEKVISAACPHEALALDPAVECGYVPVPLEREHPKEE